MATDLGRSTNIRIGLTIPTMADVKVEPHVEFMDGAEVEKSLCGNDRWIGSPRCRWTYPGMLLTGEQYYQLKSLGGNNPSVSVTIDVPTQEIDVTTYTPIIATYTAVMHWPAEDVTIISHNHWSFPDEGLLFTQLVGV